MMAAAGDWESVVGLVLVSGVHLYESCVTYALLQFYFIYFYINITIAGDANGL